MSKPLTNWNEMIEEFLTDQSDWSQRTVEWYRARLRPFGEFLAEQGVNYPQAIEVRHINRFLAKLREANLSWSTRNGCYTAIQAFFGWLRRMKLVRKNPFNDRDSGLKRPRKTKKVVHDIPLEYIRQMIEVAEAEDTVMNRRDAAIMRLLATTGMRREEVIRLSLNDLDMERGDIRMIRGKGDNERLGFLKAETVKALRHWLEARPKTDNQAIFISLQANKKGLHQELNPDAINDVVKKWQKQAGLPEISMSPHKWRHTFATALAKAKNPFGLQALLGHSDIKTTSIYVHCDREVLYQMVRDFGPEIDRVPHVKAGAKN
jgi:integrase/recombinase XerC